MGLLNKTFTMPRTKFNKGFVHIGKTFKVIKKIRGLDRYTIVLLTKTGSEAKFRTCAGTQWLKKVMQ